MVKRRVRNRVPVADIGRRDLWLLHQGLDRGNLLLVEGPCPTSTSIPFPCGPHGDVRSFAILLVDKSTALLGRCGTVVP